MDRLHRSQDGIDLRWPQRRILFLADSFMIDLVMLEELIGSNAAVSSGLLLCVPRPYGRIHWLVVSSGPHHLLLSLNSISPDGRVSSVLYHDITNVPAFIGRT